MTFQIEWIDRGRPPSNPPNPRYPDGIDIVIAKPGQKSCKVDLPYPPQQKNVGLYIIKCDLCGMTTACTTAARPDDPRSITVPCKEKKHEVHDQRQDQDRGGGQGQGS